MSNNTQEKKQKLLEMLKIFMENNMKWEDKKTVNYLMEMEKLSPDPYLSDYIFWPKRYGYKEELTPEEIVDICFSYQPIITPPPPKKD